MKKTVKNSNPQTRIEGTSKNQSKGTGRRRLLKNVLVGGSLTGLSTQVNWVKPVVHAIALPAHAQTSDVPDESPQNYFAEITNTTAQQNVLNPEALLASLMSSLGNLVVPNVNAQPVPVNNLLCINVTGTLATVQFLQSFGSTGYLYEGSGELGMLFSLVLVNCVAPSFIDFQVQNPTAATVGYQFGAMGVPQLLPAAACGITTPVMCPE